MKIEAACHKYSTDQDNTTSTHITSHVTDNNNSNNFRDINTHINDTLCATPTQVPSCYLSPLLSRPDPTSTLNKNTVWVVSTEMPSGCLYPSLSMVEPTLNHHHTDFPVLEHRDPNPNLTLTLPPSTISLTLSPISASHTPVT